MGKVIASCGHELGPDEGPDGHGYPVSWEEYDGPDLVTCHATYCKACAEALKAYQGAAPPKNITKEQPLNERT
jgi:hypothetical protein